MTPSRCKDRQEAITALILGVIEENQAAEILEHLQHCNECMALYDELAQEEAVLHTTFLKMRARNESQASPPLGTGTSSKGTSAVAFSKARRVGLQIARWKHMPALAIAAILLLSAAGLFSRLGLPGISQGTAFGAVVQRMAAARSVSYTKIVQYEGGPSVTSQEMATDQGIFRSANSQGIVRILDFANNCEITIDPMHKAFVVARKPFRDNRTLTSYLGWADPVHEADGEWKGLTDLDGTRANVFTIARPFEEITIWTDVHTNLPVRVEMIERPCLDKSIRMPEMTLSLDEFRDGEGAAESLAMGASDHINCIVIRHYAPGVCRAKKTTILTGFTWNGPVDQSLLQVAVPEGYQVTEVDDGDPPRGQDVLVAALRFWAEGSEGAFPADIDALLDSKPLLIWKFASSEAPEQGYTEAIKVADTIVAGSLFAQQLKAMDNWHYAGADVRLGEADKPLCWWKSKDPTIYCVIYGDLAIRDIPATDLPTIKNPQ